MATARVSPSPFPSPPASAPAFLSRVRSFVEVLNNSSNFDEGNIDNLLTRGSFLYHPAVRLASANIVGGGYDTSRRTVVDLLTEMEESEDFSF